MRSDAQIALLAASALCCPVAAHAQIPPSYAQRPIVGITCDLSAGGAKGLAEKLGPLLSKFKKTPEVAVCEKVRNVLQKRVEAYQFVLLQANAGEVASPKVDDTLNVALVQRDPNLSWVQDGWLDLEMDLASQAKDKCSRDLCRFPQVLKKSLDQAGLPDSLEKISMTIEQRLGGKEDKIYDWLQIPIHVQTEERPNGVLVTNLQYAAIKAEPGTLFSVGDPKTPGIKWLRACSPRSSLVAGPALANRPTCTSATASVTAPISGKGVDLYYFGTPPGPVGSRTASVGPANLLRGDDPLASLSKDDKGKSASALLDRYHSRIDDGPMTAGPAGEIAAALSETPSKDEVTTLCRHLVTKRRSREALDCVAGATAMSKDDKERIALEALGAFGGLLPDEVREAATAIAPLAKLWSNTAACNTGTPATLDVEAVVDQTLESGLAAAVYYQLALTEQTPSKRYCYVSHAAHTCLGAFGKGVTCSAPRSLAFYLEEVAKNDGPKLDATIQRFFVKQSPLVDKKCDWKGAFCRSPDNDSTAVAAVLEMQVSLAYLLDARKGTPSLDGPLSPRFHVESAERLWAQVHPGTSLIAAAADDPLHAYFLEATRAATPGNGLLTTPRRSDAAAGSPPALGPNAPRRAAPERFDDIY